MEFTVYKKTEESEDYTKGAKKKKAKASTPKPEEQTGVPEQSKEETKKSKYVPLYSKDGKAADTVQLAGRHPCECQAVKHPLVNNCLACGRIVCAQEGSSPCLFCASLVVTREEQLVLDNKTKKSEMLYKELAGDSRSQYQTALDNKERLLDYDANSAKRTQIIDDESDYFSVDSNKWLTPQQREALKKSRLDRRITFDLLEEKWLRMILLLSMT